ncbi:MAG: hypothetical protein ACRCY4_08025 [Brevinema sp.]
MKKIHVILGALFLTSACALSDIGRLNPEFLTPLNNVLFVNEFQINDPQYLFDAPNQTVTVRSRTAADAVNGIYELQLVANPASDQAVYRMIGTKGYNNLFMGIQYVARGLSNFSAKIVVQNSEITARDALNSLLTTPYVNSSVSSYPYYRASAAGTWARVSSTGIYNAAISDHFTFNYNELVDRGVEDSTHTLLYVNISGAVTNSSRYNLQFVSNISSSSVIYSLTAVDSAVDAPLDLRFIGIDIVSTDRGNLRAKIITSPGQILNTPGEEITFANLLATTSSADYTTLSSVERPDVLLAPLKTKGPWVYVNGNVYDQVNTTNWDFSLQDQSVTITAFGTAAGAMAGIPVDYSLQATSTPLVFRLVNQTANGALNNKFFTFKFRTLSGQTIERASFYLEDSVDVATARLNGPSFLDNYVNIYSAGLLGNGTSAVNYSLRLNTDLAALPAFVKYDGLEGISSTPIYGATVFTRSEAGTEYVYVVGGASAAGSISRSEGMYEVIMNPALLRNSISRTASFGVSSPTAPVVWEDISFSISGSAALVTPFAGQPAWIGNRLFIYNPAKYTILPDPDLSPNYRIISTSTFSGAWTPLSLPADLTNRPHAAFFSSQGVLTLVGGMHYTPSPDSGVTPDTYTITNDVWQSFNNGATWAQVARSTAFSPRYMATVLTIGSEIYMLGGYTASTSDGDFSDEIWKSTDNGLTWTKVQGSIPAAVANSYDSRKYGRMGGFVINNTLYITDISSAIYSSKDGGQNWAQETLVDTDGANVFSREDAAIGSGYVWSANNKDIKGVLFGIGGFNRDLNNINPNVNLRVLRR